MLYPTCTYTRGQGSRHRAAFTLPELLVAMALIIFIMAILAEAFEAGLDSFRKLRATGEMQEKLRMATSVMRDDLLQYYVEQTTSSGGVSTTSQMSLRTLTINPTAGFFRISQGPNQVVEGNDDPATLSSTYPAPGTQGLGMFSVRATDQLLYFTVRKFPPQTPDHFFTGRVGAPQPATTTPLWQNGPVDYQTANLLNEQFAEVGYYLRPNGNFAGNTPLFALYRRQCVVLSTTEAGQYNPPTAATPVSNLGGPAAPWSWMPGTWWNTVSEVSCRPDPVVAGTLHFNTMTDLATGVAGNPAGRRTLWDSMTIPPVIAAGGAVPAVPTPMTSANNPYYPTYRELGQVDPATGGPAWLGDDILLTDVISFQIQILPVYPNAPSGAPPGAQFQQFQFIDLPPQAALGGQQVYDTSMTPLPTNATLPGSGPYGIAALKISIRIWDAKSQQTMQITLIQDMTGSQIPTLGSGI